MRLGVFTLMFLILFALKVAGVTTLSWAWVFLLPAAGAVLVWGIFLGAVFLVALLASGE